MITTYKHIISSCCNMLLCCVKRPAYRFIRKPAQKEAKLIVNVREAVTISIILSEHDNSARIRVQTLHCANLKKRVTPRIADKVKITQRIVAYRRV